MKALRLSSIQELPRDDQDRIRMLLGEIHLGCKSSITYYLQHMIKRRMLGFVSLCAKQQSAMDAKELALNKPMSNQARIDLNIPSLN